jgi:hypothetical protein
MNTILASLISIVVNLGSIISAFCNALGIDSPTAHSVAQGIVAAALLIYGVRLLWLALVAAGVWLVVGLLTIWTWLDRPIFPKNKNF